MTPNSLKAIILFFSLVLVRSAVAAQPVITNPAPGSTLTNSSVTFQWSSSTDATEYFLSIGTAAAATNLYSQSQGLNLYTTVTNLPTNGMTLYARLWWLTSGGWQSGDYTYTAAGTNTPVPQMISPAPGSTLTNTSATFQWTYGAGATQYYLAAGNSPGATNLFAQNEGLNSVATVTGLPTNGMTLYVRLSWLTTGGWQSGDYTYTMIGTNTPTPMMISPTPGSTLTNTSAMFQWTYGAGVTKFYLAVGSALGATNLFYKNEGVNLSATVTNLPTNGMTLYVRLWWQTSGGFQSSDFTYTMTGTNTPVPQMISPAPGSTLTNSSATFQWTYGAGATGYYLWVGTSLGATNIYSRNENLNSSATVTNLPANGMTLYVRLWWQTSGGFQSSDYTYTMAGTNTPVPVMISPAPGSTLASSSATFQWSYGADATKYYLWVGSTMGASDIYNQNASLNVSATVNRLPTNGMTLYVRLWWLDSSAWQSGDYTYQAVTALRAVRQGGNIIVSWPTNDPAYSLEYATNLPASAWFTNPVSPSILNGRFTVTNRTPNPFTIYRLIK